MAHGADMVVESRNMSDDVLFTPALIVLMPPTICWLGAWSVRDFVTSSQSGSVAHRSGVASSAEQQETGCTIRPERLLRMYHSAYDAS